MNTMELKNKLIRIGLTREEIAVILYVAENNETKVASISNKLKISRSSLYRLIDSLEQKGLIKKVLTTQGNNITLSNLENLKNQIEERKQEIEQQLNGFEELTNSILALKKLNKPSPEVRYFEGKEGIRQIIWDTLKSKNTIRCYTNAIRKEIVGAKWLTDYCLRFVNNNLDEKVLGDQIYAENSYQPYGGRQKYYLPVIEYFRRSDERILNIPFLKIKGEIYIYNNIFSFYTWEGEKLIGAEIQSEFISLTQSSIFDVIWNMTKEDNSIDYMEANDN